MKYENTYYHIDDTWQFEFVAMKKYLWGLGCDWGCGSNRLSPTVLSIDSYPHKEADLVWDILEKPFPFADNVFNFVFSSHCIEDMPTDRTQYAFDELVRITKVGGHVVLLVPDMESGRYPKWDEVFTADSLEVIRGERKIGELAGNPAHKQNFGLIALNKLVYGSKYKMEIVQADKLPHNQMTLDFVVKKL